MDAKSGEILHNHDLVRAVRYLYRTERITKDKDIVDAMPPYKKNTVSGYINGKIPASPEFRTKFEEAFDIELSKFNEELPPVEDPILGTRLSSEYLAGRLDGKDDVIEQIEARRRDMQLRAEKAEKENDRLLTIIETNLTKLLEVSMKLTSNLSEVKQDTSLGLSYHRAWVEYTAEEVAQGDKKKKDQKVLRMNKLLRSQIDRDQKADKSTDAHKQSKEGN
jgi:hypothetical protein